MAISVSDEFKALWGQKAGRKEVRRIRYKRRYYNGANFVNEAAWSILGEDDVADFGVIPFELDSPRENIFRTAVWSFKVYNTRNEWKVTTVPPSFFALDSVGTLGYKLHKTLFQYQKGYVLNSDSSTEWVTGFTGYALRPRMSDAGTATILVASQSSLLLEKSDPFKLATTTTLENCIPATGDGSNKDFESTSTGVDNVPDLQVDGTSLSDGTFGVSNLKQVNESGNNGRAAFTLDVAPGGAETVKCTVVKWDLNKLIDTLLDEMATEAGLSGSVINPVVIPTASGNKTIDSQANWEAGTGSSIDTTTEPGSIIVKYELIDDWDNGNYTDDPTWTKGGPGSASVTNKILTLSNAGDNSVGMSTPEASDTGVWKFVFPAGTIGGFMQLSIMMNSASFSGNGTPDGDGYAFRSLGTTVNFERITAGSATRLISDMAIWTGKTVYVVRDSSGNWKIYYDSGSGPVLQASVTDNTYTSGTHIILSNISGAGSLGAWSIDSIRFRKGAGVKYVSEEFDLGSNPDAWGIMENTQTPNGGSISVRTRVAAASGGPYDSYVALGDGNQIESAKKRYYQKEFTLTTGALNDPTISPQMDKSVSNFSTSTIVLSLADLSALQSGAAVFEEMCRLADYETGDRTDGTRFFRSKSVTGDSVVTLTQENGIIKVLDYDDGTDGILNVGRVRFGNYLEEYDGADASESSPTSEEEFGRILPPGGELNLGTRLLSSNANIALSRAQLQYERGFEAKVKLLLRVWEIPWLEIGDKVTVTIVDQPILLHSVANDPIARAGSAFFSDDDPQNVFANALQMKVLRYKPNNQTGKAELFVREI